MRRAGSWQIERRRFLSTLAPTARHGANRELGFGFLVAGVAGVLVAGSFRLVNLPALRIF